MVEFGMFGRTGRVWAPSRGHGRQAAPGGAPPVQGQAVAPPPPALCASLYMRQSESRVRARSYACLACQRGVRDPPARAVAWRACGVPGMPVPAYVRTKLRRALRARWGGGVISFSDTRTVTTRLRRAVRGVPGTGVAHHRGVRQHGRGRQDRRGDCAEELPVELTFRKRQRRHRRGRDHLSRGARLSCSFG